MADPITALRNVNPGMSGVRELSRKIQIFLGAIVLPAHRMMEVVNGGRRYQIIRVHTTIDEGVRGVQSTRIL